MKILTFILFFLAISVKAQFATNGFYLEELPGNWIFPMEVQFDNSNKMYVLERRGKVYSYFNSTKYLLLDISEEVSNFGDFGAISLKLDPNFSTNGFIYLYYVVDRHYLMNYGTSNYNPNLDEQGPTISRLVRYTVDTNNFTSIVTGSRKILIGSLINNGIPQIGQHSGGGLVFAPDGSLLVSCGDGSLYGETTENQGFNDGIISVEEYAAGLRWRCQLLNSYNGKILRIDPNTGNGISSNPFFEANNPNSPKSKVYAYGLRNPFRMSIRPNTGSTNINDGDAGSIYVNDVGQDIKEELNIVTNPGQNFGWPRYEGIDLTYLTNPNFILTDVKKPTIEWGRSGSTARAVINSSVVNFGSTEFPSNNFTGGCNVAGEFYTGSNYPLEFMDKYFFCDFNDQWIKYGNFDLDNNPLNVKDFHSNFVGLISLTYNKNDQNFYYTSVIDKIFRLKYDQNINQAPVADFTINKEYGSSPLLVNFDANNSYDPENTNLVYQWTFSDNSTASGKVISKTFTSTNTSPQLITATLKVTDAAGAFTTFTKNIYLNNTPPKITNVSIDSIYKIAPQPLNINLNANLLDDNYPIAQLKTKWEVFLYHNQHRHPEFQSLSINTNYVVDELPCDKLLYFYKFLLTVTDPLGLSAKYEKDIYGNCNASDIIPPTISTIQADHFTDQSFLISFPTIQDNIGVKFIELKINDQTVTYLPGNATNYLFQSSKSILGKEFSSQIIARDSSGNFTTSSKIFFRIPVNLCTTAQTQLSTIAASSSTNGYGPIEINMSNGSNGSGDGQLMEINGNIFQTGFGVHAPSTINFDFSYLNYTSLIGKVGIDDESGSNGSGIFKIYKDNNLIYSSPVLTGNSSYETFNVDISNANTLILEMEPTSDGISWDHGDWADLTLIAECNSLDNFSPSSPSNLSLNSSVLNFNYSIDNLDTQILYKIYIDNILIDSTFNNSYTFVNFPLGIKEISVQAVDDFGNTSTSQNLIVNSCPNSIILENISSNIFINTTKIEKAGTSIEAKNQIISNSDVIFQAGNSILLLPGFLVNNGNLFHTEIKNCN